MACDPRRICILMRNTHAIEARIASIGSKQVHEGVCMLRCISRAWSVSKAGPANSPECVERGLSCLEKSNLENMDDGRGILMNARGRLEGHPWWWWWWWWWWYISLLVTTCIRISAFFKWLLEIRRCCATIPLVLLRLYKELEKGIYDRVDWRVFPLIKRALNLRNTLPRESAPFIGGHNRACRFRGRGFSQRGKDS
jgi:hypothetical protein